MEVILLTVVVLGLAAMKQSKQQSESFDPHINQQNWEVPVQLPRIEGRDFDPPSNIPWGEVSGGEPLPQGERSMLPLWVEPQIWVEKTESKSAGFYPKVNFNPLYPDDLRAYDTLRSRAQKVYRDTSKRDFQWTNHHQPYIIRNATKQEVSQTENLAGRIYVPYTTGGQDRNDVFHLGQRTPSNTIVRQKADHVINDRAQTQVWTKRIQNEITGNIILPPLANEPAINHPDERSQPAKVRNFSRYLNARNFQHGWIQPFAPSQEAMLMDANPLKQKRLLLVGDSGFPSSQTSFVSGYDGALTYPHTGRRREINPSVQHPGLFQGGTGRTNFDQNTGNDNIGNSETYYNTFHSATKMPGSKTPAMSVPTGTKQSRTRIVMVPGLTEGPFIRGEGSAYGSVWNPHDPTVDYIRQPKGEQKNWEDQAVPCFPTEIAHTLEIPLLR